MMRRMRRLAWLLSASLAVACAQDPAPAPTPPAGAYEGGSRAGAIDRTSLEEEVTDAGILNQVLDEAGFAGGTFRRWSLTHAAGIRQVEVRALRFSSAQGAATYLGWVSEHPEDLVGGGTAATVSDRVVLSHEPGGCCPGKDTSLVVAAWTDGDVVWMVRLGGPEADAAAAHEVADAIEGGTDGA